MVLPVKVGLKTKHEYVRFLTYSLIKSSVCVSLFQELLFPRMNARCQGSTLLLLLLIVFFFLGLLHSVFFSVNAMQFRIFLQRELFSQTS